VAVKPILKPTAQSRFGSGRFDAVSLNNAREKSRQEVNNIVWHLALKPLLYTFKR